MHPATRPPADDALGMKTTPYIAGALLAATLTGCASLPAGDHVWVKEGATPQEQSAALAAAQAQAAQARTTPVQERDLVLRAMTAQGWRLQSKASAPPLRSAAARAASRPLRSGTAAP